MHRIASHVVCPWHLRGRLNALLAPPHQARASYEIRPLSSRPGEPMAEIWVDDSVVWLIHRKITSTMHVDQPDPKRWTDPATGIRHVLRHDDGFYCDECPRNKHGQGPFTAKRYCPSGERRFSNG